MISFFLYLLFAILCNFFADASSVAASQNYALSEFLWLSRIVILVTEIGHEFEVDYKFPHILTSHMDEGWFYGFMDGSLVAYLS